jgi:hypothetical protein
VVSTCGVCVCVCVCVCECVCVCVCVGWWVGKWMSPGAFAAITLQPCASGVSQALQGLAATLACDCSWCSSFCCLFVRARDSAWPCLRRSREGVTARVTCFASFAYDRNHAHAHEPRRTRTHAPLVELLRHGSHSLSDLLQDGHAMSSARSKYRFELPRAREKGGRNKHEQLMKHAHVGNVVMQGVEGTRNIICLSTQWCMWSRPQPLEHRHHTRPCSPHVCKARV